MIAKTSRHLFFKRGVSDSFSRNEKENLSFVTRKDHVYCSIEKIKNTRTLSIPSHLLLFLPLFSLRQTGFIFLLRTFFSNHLFHKLKSKNYDDKRTVC